MLSKYSIWDFDHKIGKKALLEESLLNCTNHLPINLLVEDSILQKSIIDETISILYNNDNYNYNDNSNSNLLEKKSLGAKEVSISWLQQTLFAPTLWDNDNQIYIIQNGDDLTKDKTNFFIKNKLKLSSTNISCKIIIIFSKNTGPFSILTKEDIGTSIKIEAPRFYEFRKLLDYWTRKFAIKNLTDEGKSYFCEIIKPNTYDYYTNFSKIVLFSEGLNQNEKIDVKDLQKLLFANNMDFFKLAKLFSQKKFKEFFSMLINNHSDQSSNMVTSNLISSELKNLSIFMQGHLLKICDPSYLQYKKSKLNLYEQEIISYSKHWDKREIKRALRFFANIEKSSKQKDPLILHSLALKKFLSKQ
ncbi:MAG: hypothetical protein HQK49_01055 [Oligoflexia bacterium]|nr:hypothetical protein [Oligoflexia bacterium]